LPHGGRRLDDLNKLPTLSFVGRYAVKHLLGQGGVGTVHAAVDPILQRVVALKMLRMDAHPSQRTQHEALLLAEARAAAALSHPNIVAIFDAGSDEQGVYIAMERLEGVDLRERLAHGHRPSPWEAATLVARVADALHYAHGMGLIHCDIKPSNIMLAPNGQPKVLDFGIARGVMSVQANALGEPPNTAALALSPWYAAPEQFEDQPVDARCDIHALGVILYEMLTGQRPYVGDSLAQVKQRVLEGRPVAPQLIDPRIPSDLAGVAMQAMAPLPGHRFAHALAMRAALEHCVEAHERRMFWKPSTHTASSGSNSTSTKLPALTAFGFVAALLLASNTLPPLQTRHGTPERVGISEVPAAQSISFSSRATDSPTPQAASKVLSTQASGQLQARSIKPPSVEVSLAITPWGRVEVNGKFVGVTPPLTKISLKPGRHRVVVRNADFKPFESTIVVPDASDRATVAQASRLRLSHRFESIESSRLAGLAAAATRSQKP
jgi:eukaryotic-like serine/threonine-protein kinase